METLLSWVSVNVKTLQTLGGVWVGLGLISLALTVVALPVIVIRLPADYFVRHKRVPIASESAHPAAVLLISTMKNIVGILLIVFGAVMLFIPGQGILTMLIGLLLANFPGKYRLEQKIVRRPTVLRTLNRVRSRAGKEALIAPDPE